MADPNVDKLSERLHLEQFSRVQPATTKQPGPVYRLPWREARTQTAKRLLEQTGDIEAVLDERTVLRHLEAGLDHDYRPIRGIMAGVAFGALLWIPLIAALAIVI